MIREVWAPLHGYEDEYLISTHGRVLSRPRVVTRSDGKPQTIPGRLIKLCRDSHGYQQFSPWKDRVKKTVRVHQAVLKTFVGPAPEGNEACHWDDDKTNNHLDNLRWATRSDNTRDAVRNGTHNHANKTHCKRGHEFNAENTYQKPDGRGCRICKRELNRRYAKQKRQQQPQN